MSFQFPILIIATLLGALYMALRFRRLRLSIPLGAGVGAVGGIVGSLLFMLPLNYCMFDPERDLIDAVFGVILIALGMAIILIPSALMIGSAVERRRNPNSESAGGARQGQFRGLVAPFMLLLPTLIILALFLYYPSLETFRLSTLLTRLGAPRSAFVCVDNFTSLASNTVYLNAFATTLFLSVAIVALSLALGLLVATAVFQPIKGASIYRTLLVWPYAISPAVAGVIFLLLFNPTGGIINYFLNNTIGISIPWLNNPSAAPWVVVIASVWKILGYNILFYLAGLQNIGRDLTESAAIDGANAIKRFYYITLPLLSPITFFLLITNTTFAFFDTFGTIDYLTGGGPLRATTTLMYNIYEVGVTNGDLGKAAAQSIVLFALVIGFTILQFRTAGQRVTYGA